MFGVLGYMSGKMNCDVDQVIQDGSFGLAFIVFPAALAMMPAPQFFSVLFFLTLLNLGVDSAFAMVEVTCMLRGSSAVVNLLVLTGFYYYST